MRRLLLATFVAWPALLSAQPSAQGSGGFDASLHGSSTAIIGGEHRVRGRAFEVRGLATLRALPGATIKARYVGEAPDVDDGPWVETRADREGVFALHVAIPETARGPSRLEVEVGNGERHRTLLHSIRLQNPFIVTLQTDRGFYEPGETVHSWVLMRDRRTLAPLADRELTIEVDRLGRVTREAVRTDASGVAHLSTPLRDDESPGTYSVRAMIGDTAHQVLDFTVGRRTQERLMAELEWDDAQYTPGQAFAPRVLVSAPSGAVVRNARVILHVGDRDPIEMSSDGEGIARFTTETPAYLADESGTVLVRAEVRHRAHGTAQTSKLLRLAMPLSLTVRGIAGAGALVPEIPSQLFVHVLDAAGDPPEAGTRVKVRGPGVRPAEHATDEHGLIALDVTLRRGDASRHQSGDCRGNTAASFDVEIEGPRARHARFCVPVWPEVRVRPVANEIVRAPGEPLIIRLRRRPDARRALVSVALVRDGILLDSRITRANEVRFDTPNTLGLLQAVTRVVSEPGRAESAESYPAMEPILVRPANPSFPEAAPQRPVYSIGSEATVDVHTRPGAPGWLAVDVRDLAQHGGERPFRMYFLRAQVRKALFDPATAELDRLARASLATLARPETPRVAGELVDEFGRASGERYAGPDGSIGDIRDPIAAANELKRRGLQPLMMSIERALLATDDVTTLVEGNGARRRFRDDLLREIAPDSEIRTLGDQPVTIAALRDADDSFGFGTVARRVTRIRLVRALVALSVFLSDDSSHGDELPSRWVSRLVQLGLLEPSDLEDPWGGTLGVRPRPEGTLSVAPNAPDRTLAFPGPDGRLNTRDDILDPFERVVRAGTPYAQASGEDQLMRSLSVIAPGPQALQLMIQAHERMTRAQLEAQTGDAVTAEASQGMLMGDQVGESFGFGGLGMIGTGGGGGGMGYGRGAGRLGSRTARVPRIRAGHASLSMSGSLRGLVREEFPGTLHFVPTMPVDASGTTAVTIPLAHAATTYLVEIVHWRPDGWVWSTETRVRVDQDLVVDAPVPRFVTEGDAIKLPLRAANRTSSPMEVALSVHPEGELELEARTTPPATIAPNDSHVVEVELTARGGSGHLRVEGRSSNVDDATRRPFDVLPNARRVVHEVDGLLAEGQPLMLRVPRAARPRRGGRVIVTTGHAMFGGDGAWLGWAEALRGRPTPNSIGDAADRVGSMFDDEGNIYGEPIDIALSLAVLWNTRAHSDDRARAMLTKLTEALVVAEPDEAQTEHAALGLLALAPAIRQANRRGELGTIVRNLAQSLRATLERGATAFSDAPSMHAVTAAALAWTGDETRAREHVRRANRALIRFDDEVWLQARASEHLASSQNLAPSAALAIAYAGLDERGAAFELVRTLGARAMASRAAVPRWRRFQGEERGLASAAAFLIMGPTRDSLAIEVDGERRTIELAEGVGELSELAIDRPGEHRVRVLDVDAPVHVRAQTEYALPWQSTPARRGPFSVIVTPPDEPAHRVDHVDTYTIRIHNTRPQTLRHAVLEIDLPTGAELDETAFEHLERRLVRRPVHEQKTMRMELRTLLPGRSIEIPLRLRWTVAGRLRGLGVSAHAAPRPDRAVVIAPRVLEIEGGGR